MEGNTNYIRSAFQAQKFHKRIWFYVINLLVCMQNNHTSLHLRVTSLRSCNALDYSPRSLRLLCVNKWVGYRKITYACVKLSLQQKHKIFLFSIQYVWQRVRYHSISCFQAGRDREWFSKGVTHGRFPGTSHLSLMSASS